MQGRMSLAAFLRSPSPAAAADVGAAGAQPKQKHQQQKAHALRGAGEQRPQSAPASRPVHNSLPSEKIVRIHEDNDWTYEDDEEDVFNDRQPATNVAVGRAHHRPWSAQHRPPFVVASSGASLRHFYSSVSQQNLQLQEMAQQGRALETGGDDREDGERHAGEHRVAASHSRSRPTSAATTRPVIRPTSSTGSRRSATGRQSPSPPRGSIETGHSYRDLQTVHVATANEAALQQYQNELAMAVEAACARHARRLGLPTSSSSQRAHHPARSADRADDALDATRTPSTSSPPVAATSKDSTTRGTPHAAAHTDPAMSTLAIYQRSIYGRIASQAAKGRQILSSIAQHPSSSSSSAARVAAASAPTFGGRPRGGREEETSIVGGGGPTDLQQLRAAMEKTVERACHRKHALLGQKL